MSQSTIAATIHERGNGLAGIGDYLIDGNSVYEIMSHIGPIHTGRAGAGNYVHAMVRDTGMSVSDLSDEQYEDITCSLVLLDDRG